MEFAALFIAYIPFLAEYNFWPNEFPPFSVSRLRGDSKSANKWIRTISAGSFIAQNLLRLFANYHIHFPVKGDTNWIAGDNNKEIDNLSCVQELFLPQKLKFMISPMLLF